MSGYLIACDATLGRDVSWFVTATTHNQVGSVICEPLVVGNATYACIIHAISSSEFIGFAPLKRQR